MKQPYVVLDRASALSALQQLAHSLEHRAPVVYVAILEALGTSMNGGRSCRLPIVNGEPEMMRSMHIRTGLVECVRPQRWLAIYQHPDNEELTVTVRTPDRPPRRRTFRGPVGSGRRKYVLVKRSRLTSTEDTMARTTTKTKAPRSRKAKAPETVDVDDLEELEALEELEDDDEDEAPAPKRTRSRRKKAAEVVEEDDDETDEDDDEEDEEDDEPAPPKRQRKRSDKQAKPGKDKSAKATTKRQPPPPRELPKGKVGVEDVAKLAGTDGRTVRQYLRKEGIEKTDGRYAFTAKEAKSMASAIKKRGK